jgi:uncharacterized membrane protein
MRRHLAQQGFGADRGFRWRGGEISRLEGLSDAVFAFAVTLLVVFLEVPETFDELLRVLRGFFAFAVCFSILFWVWYDHYRFFRRYGLADGVTTTLTGALLFIVLFYVYPMKFLFTMLFDQLFGDTTVQAIQPRQAPLLMTVYGAGFIAVQVVFVLLHLRAYGLADTLELDTYELLTTRAEIQGFALNAVVGLASILIVVIGGPDAAFWSGMTYVLIMPLQFLNGRVMGARIRHAATTSAQEPSPSRAVPTPRRVARARLRSWTEVRLVSPTMQPGILPP